MEALRATVRGGLITIGEVDDISRPRWKHLRGRVTDFTRGAFSRLSRYLATCTAKYRTMLTLTMPVVEVQKGEFKERLDKMLEWLRLRSAEQFPGQVWSACWVLEFQKRGAPHVHVLLTHPSDYKNVAARWCVLWADALAPVTLEKMALAATRIETLKSRADAAKYLARYVGKEHSKVLPAGVESFGRWWGVRGDRSRLPPRYFEYTPLPNRYKDKTGLLHDMGRALLVVTDAYSPCMRIFRWKYGQGVTIYQKMHDEMWADFVKIFERVIQAWGLIRVPQYASRESQAVPAAVVRPSPKSQAKKDWEQLELCL